MSISNTKQAEATGLKHRIKMTMRPLDDFSLVGVTNGYALQASISCACPSQDKVGGLQQEGHLA